MQNMSWNLSIEEAPRRSLWEMEACRWKNYDEVDGGGTGVADFDGLSR